MPQYLKGGLRYNQQYYGSPKKDGPGTHTQRRKMPHIMPIANYNFRQLQVVTTDTIYSKIIP